MVRAWYLKDAPDSEKQLPNYTDPLECVSVDQLQKLTMIKYWKINVGDLENDPQLNAIRQEEGYTFEDDVVMTREQLGAQFYAEHLHEADESRLVLAGSGYFDVRTLPSAAAGDRWVRVEVTPGDMLVLPGGCYHRFTVDETEYCKIHRFFKDGAGRSAINRPAEDNPARQQYLKRALATTA